VCCVTYTYLKGASLPRSSCTNVRLQCNASLTTTVIALGDNCTRSRFIGITLYRSLYFAPPPSASWLLPINCAPGDGHQMDGSKDCQKLTTAWIFQTLALGVAACVNDDIPLNVGVPRHAVSASAALSSAAVSCVQLPTQGHINICAWGQSHTYCPVPAQVLFQLFHSCHWH
jgi:hypothetical protein